MSKPRDGRPRLINSRNLRLVQDKVGLDDDEQVLLLERKHWHIFRNSLFVGLFVPFVLLSLMGLVYLADVQLGDSTRAWLWYAVAAASILCFVGGFSRFLWQHHLWKHTFYVMTNKKLAIINRHKPFSYEAQQINLSHINDITVRKEGMQAFLYDYSDVIAITFSGSTFVFEEVGHAVHIQKAIMQQLALQKPVGSLPVPDNMDD